MAKERIGKLLLANQKAASVFEERIAFSFGQNWRKFLTNIEESTVVSTEVPAGRTCNHIYGGCQKDIVRCF
jgi:hypothetical protein